MLANALTLFRLALAPVLVVAVIRQSYPAASVIFFLAVATDFADGNVARRSGSASPRGALFDHAVDAIFCTAGTAALAHAGALPAALPPLIAAAFLQDAADSRILSARGLRASALGRWNGIAYYVIVAIPILRDGLGLSWPGGFWVAMLGWGLVVTTVASILDRARLLFRCLSSRVAS